MAPAAPAHSRMERSVGPPASQGAPGRDAALATSGRAGRRRWRRWWQAALRALTEAWPKLERATPRGDIPADPRHPEREDGGSVRRGPLGLLPAASALASLALVLLLLLPLLPTPGEGADAAPGPAEETADPTARRTDDADRAQAGFGPPREAEVVRALRAWRDALAERAREVDADRTAAHALMERIDRRIAELDERIGRLEALREEIRGLLGEVEAREQERIARLVSIYEGMKPRQAAGIFERLDMETLLPIAERMRPARLALILQNMEPERAREVTRRLSKRTELPDLSALGPFRDTGGKPKR